MKKLFTIMLGMLVTSYGFTQGNNWKLDGNNNVSSSSFIGSTNNEPFILKANGIEGLRIKPNGELRVNSFDDNSSKGIVWSNANGVLNKLNFTGNNNDYLSGNGTFLSLSNISGGWSVLNNVTFTNNNVGIGTNLAPEKLTVNGNIIASGSISGTSLNVIDIITSGKEFKVSTSLCMKGVDVNDPNSRNEICGMNGNLFIQSEHNNPYNTIFNLGNTGRVGFGIIPTEDFHVGKSARFEAGVNFSGISSTNELDDLLFINDDGKIIRGGPGLLAAELWDLEDCLQDIDGNTMSTWHAGLGKVTTGTAQCEGDTKVGINVINPLHNFHNNGTSFLKGITGIGGNPTGHTAWLYIQSNNSDDAIRFNTGSGTQFKVDGTGKITARDIKVTLNAIPDYVFKPEYKLPSIKEQENYIENNGHLLGVPSEKEMVEGETTIGELEMINLRLNEEQMLYLIDISKRLDKLESENSALKEKIEIQSKEIKELKGN